MRRFIGSEKSELNPVLSVVGGVFSFNLGPFFPPENVSDFRRRENEETGVSVLFKILICFDKLWHSITINRRDKTPPRQNLATGEGRAMNSFNSLINITS